MNTGDAKSKARPSGMELELVQALLERMEELYEFPETVHDCISTASNALQEGAIFLTEFLEKEVGTT